ncbi:transglycosylase SLT domain-containing protein [Sandarakinorhabdus sp. DWP1-3-1]|uniref:transglycosylase SLT domain-containing protein n=1 Tax=Sandarakinorhabdus sp. DWP1-3-1 TaxID=2804627 RepID=UPI003CEE0836
MTQVFAVEAMTERVTGAVRSAAARTGVDFSYLMAQARVESGLNPAARAQTSSASGLFQFTAATWLETVRKHGAEHGLGWAADAIGSGVAGAGSAARATILALRDNADAAALMAGEFAADNGAALAAKLQRAVGATDLYMAHFLGAGGATRFLKTLQNAPETTAASLFPAAAAANRSVFYGRDGAARSVGDVYARFAAKLGAGGPLSPLAASVSSRPLPQPEAPPSRQRERDGGAVPASGNALPVAADRARLAYLLLAELGA